MDFTNSNLQCSSQIFLKKLRIFQTPSDWRSAGQAPNRQTMPSIHHLLTIEANAATIFEVLTSPKGLSSWWTVKAHGSPKLGSTYQFYFDDQYDWRAEVVEVNPPVQISWQMRDADEDWLPTQLHFNLEETPDGRTTVRFAHTSWENINDHFRRTSFCWAQYLDKLREVAEEL